MARRRARPQEARDRERTASERLVEIFEVLPGLYSADQLYPLMPEDDDYVRLLLERLADRRVLQKETIDGTAAYWDPAHGFDPRRGVLRALGLMPLRFPLNKAVRRARSVLERKVLRYREEVRGHEFSYVPLWRVPAEVSLGKGRVGKDLYVHGSTRKLAVLNAGRLTFRDVVRPPAWKIQSLVSPAQIDRVPPDKVRNDVRPVRVAPDQAAETVRQAVGAKPNPSRVELCLLPLWRFEVRHREEKARRPRHVWVEGTFGTVYRESP